MCSVMRMGTRIWHTLRDRMISGVLNQWIARAKDTRRSATIRSDMGRDGSAFLQYEEGHVSVTYERSSLSDKCFRCSCRHLCRSLPKRYSLPPAQDGLVVCRVAPESPGRRLHFFGSWMCPLFVHTTRMVLSRDHSRLMLLDTIFALTLSYFPLPEERQMHA